MENPGNIKRATARAIYWALGAGPIRGYAYAMTPISDLTMTTALVEFGAALILTSCVWLPMLIWGIVTLADRKKK